MRRPLLIIAGVLLTILFWRGCLGEQETAAPPVTPRVLTPEQILRLAANPDRPLRLRTARDVLPGGLSAAMAPALIDWDASEIGRADGFVVVHNVNYGGNPAEGTTVLQTVRIPLDGVERVEWILVPLGPGGRRAVAHHGQLRCVFRDDRPVELVDLVPEAAGGDRELVDLVFSWEAWRRPGEDYSILEGMDPDAYRLGLRVFAGPQRFLEDALAGRDWYVTQLRLPGGAEGPAELLKVVLAMGDGVARHTISELFAVVREDWLEGAPASDRARLAGQWDALQALARPRDVVRDERLELPAEERTYQTLLRSCATIAHHNIVVAVERLAERGLADGVVRERLDTVALGGDEPWMADVADTDLAGLLMRAPLALRWLRANPQALPDRIPGLLDAAGLVRREDGDPVERHYALDGETPYGALAANLVR